jgi:hypothetical protein
LARVGRSPSVPLLDDVLLRPMVLVAVMVGWDLALEMVAAKVSLKA